ncbi:MAG: superoxide dismutase [Woeseiaceae bacterium]|nr:superoxide dismutase [Woeseiaceae bacterium]
MAFKLSDLPYSHDALAPHISAQTLELHHGKHHKGYIKKLNKAIDDTPYAEMKLEEIVAKAKKNGDKNVFNNAAQSWNHEFLWNSMSPGGGGDASGELKSAIDRDFGDMDRFRRDFRKAATGQFGSGWVWLVHDDGELRIRATGNADTPIADGKQPLLTLDVWEHAYYLDYQNQRKRYIEAFLDELVNWKFAASNFETLRKAA